MGIGEGMRSPTERRLLKRGEYIAVDFDGTLVHHDGYRGPYFIGDPIPAMVDRVKGWLAEGKPVKIFTARVASATLKKNFGFALGDRDVHHCRVGVEKPIQEWCEKHLGKVLEITCEKDFLMRELWDDRAVSVKTNTGEHVRA